MTISIHLKLFTRLLSGLALITLFLILPHNAKADAIAATGQCINPNTRNGFGCVDPNYQPAISLGTNIFLQKTDLSGTSPGFLAAPAGPSGAFWIAQLSDVQFGEAVNDWRVTFTTPAGTGLQSGETERKCCSEGSLPRLHAKSSDGMAIPRGVPHHTKSSIKTRNWRQRLDASYAFAMNR